MLKKIVIKVSVIAFACAISIAAHAYGNDLKQVKIPAGELGAALHLLAEQTGVELFYRSDQVKGRHTLGVSGSLSARDAVTRLLEGSGLVLKTDSTGAMLIVAPGSAAAAPQSQAGGNPPNNDTTDTGAQKSGFWDRFRVAQADRGAVAPAAALDSQGPDSSDSGAAAGKGSEAKAAIPEILVSGSKILNTDLVRTDDDAQPYTFLSGESIQLSGATSVENYLTQYLTMNASSQAFSQQTDSQAGNISSINLRGLGPNQTLILINGHRLSPFYFFGTTYQPDINNIPAAAIERIEVLPSSSAAIYGGSAVGGVVNVVLKHNYDGGEVRASYDTPSDGAAPMRTFDAAYGTQFEDGRTHVMLAAHYSTGNPLMLRDRLNIVQRGIDEIEQNYPSYYSNPGAPPFWGSTPNIAAVNGSVLQLKPSYGGQSLGSAITHISAGTSAGTSAAALGLGLLQNAGSYNLSLGNVAGQGSFGSGLDAQMAGAPTAKSFLTTVSREMTDWLELFVDFSHSENISRINEAIFAYSQYVPASAPTNPFTTDVIVGYPDAHSAVLTTELATNRLTAGAIFKLGHGWQAEADYTWNTNRFTYSGQTYDYGQTINAAFASGEVNPFLDTLANPQALGQFVGSYGSYFPTSLDDVALRVSGPTVKLPAGAVTVTVGLEHRKEAVHDGFGQNTFPSYTDDNLFFTYLSQAQKTDSAYVETNLPVISADNAVPLVQLLDLQVAGRSERYSVHTGTINTTPGSPSPESESVKYSSTNYTVGLRYRPVKDLMVRMSYGTAFLPPDYSAFQPPLLGGGTPNVTTTVVDPRRGNTTEAVQYIVGGNPAIRPQTSRDWDIGLIYEPQFLEGLRLNVEWYRLTENNVAVTPTFQQLVDAESSFPDRITRAAASPGDPYGVGPITVVDASLINAARLKTDGFDFNFRLRRPIGALGTLELGSAATLIEHFQRQDSLNGPFNELVNEVGAGGPLKLRGNATLAWEKGRWTAGWTVNYFGSYRQYDLGGVTAYLQAQGADSIPSQTYHSAFARYQFPVEKGAGVVGGVLSGVSIQAGVKNIFGKLPPFDAYYNNNGFYSPFGDARLRDFWVSVAKTF